MPPPPPKRTETDRLSNRPDALKAPANDTAIVWRVASTQFRLLPPPQSPPLLMGIVNTTPDSFSDGGRFLDPSAAVDHALQLIEDGADIIDIGGQSTRPFSDTVPLDEELQRVVPAVAALSKRTAVLISVDTSKAEVARQAIDSGAQIINDVTAFEDPAMVDVARKSAAGIILMHMQGTPKTMQLAPSYADVSGEVRQFLMDRLAWLDREGIDRARVAVDAGIGFGKLFEHNMALVRQTGRLTDLGRPICFGASRKGFLGEITGRPRDRRDAATAAVSLAAYERGAHILRVHDVAATRDVVAVMRAVHQ